MREATDICHICDKVEPTPSMTYVDSENQNDDRLVCDKCNNEKENWVAWSYNSMTCDIAYDIVSEINLLLKNKGIEISSRFDDEQEDWDYKFDLWIRDQE